MPKYTFKCTKCSDSEQKIVSRKINNLECSKCGALSVRQMPSLAGPPEVRENVGEFNKTRRKDQDKLLDERQAEYYWKHEVPKMVASGIYQLDTMLEQNWVYYNEKKELVTRTKPPQKS